MLTPRQFDALTNWIRAELAAHGVRNSAGPHVRPLQRAAEQAHLAARIALTGDTTSEGE